MWILVELGKTMLAHVVDMNVPKREITTHTGRQPTNQSKYCRRVPTHQAD